jgi:hypothetical protein
MHQRTPPSYLWLAFALSLAAMHVAAWHGAKMALFGAAAVFALAVMMAAARLPSLVRTAPGDTAYARAVAGSTRITAVLYAWGATTMLSIYRFTPVQWQHGWQYGAGMLLICLCLVAYLLAFDRQDSGLSQRPALDRIVALGGLQGIAASGAVVWLVLSGKLSSPKGDWAANAVFLNGGIAIAWISYLAVATHRDLKSTAQREGLAR